MNFTHATPTMKGFFMLACLAVILMTLFAFSGSSLSVSERDLILRKIQDWQFRLQATNARNSLRLSLKIAEEMEEYLGVPKEKKTPTSVCQEHYDPNVGAYPTFFIGHVMNCTTAPPFNEVATVLLYNNNETELQMSLDRLARHYPLLPVIIASNKRLTSPSNVKWQTPSPGEAATWNTLAAAAATPYIWLGRDVNYFSWDVKLQRLVLELEITDAIITASSTRETASRKWNRNCYQVTFNNFRMEYSESYRRSEHSCLHCKYAEGPFMMRKSDFSKYKLQNDLKDSEFLFLDFFLRATQMEHGSYAVLTPRPVLVCPDSMAEVHRTRGPLEEARLGELVKWVSKYTIQEIQLPNTAALEPLLSCHVIKYDCTNRGRAGYLLSPCCRHELRRLLIDTVDFLENLGVDYLVDDGSLLGAVKFNDILPWEMDGDFAYDSHKLDKMVKAEGILKAKNYYLEAPNYETKYTSTRSKYWYIELWSLNIDVSTSSLIDIGGRYVQVPRNPGNKMRNRYGVEIYRHSEHWQTQGKKDSWVLYKSGGFQPCVTPGYHSCLENYPGDGDAVGQRRA